jgi:hypothetical protein
MKTVTLRLTAVIFITAAALTAGCVAGTRSTRTASDQGTPAPAAGAPIAAGPSTTAPPKAAPTPQAPAPGDKTAPDKGKKATPEYAPPPPPESSAEKAAMDSGLKEEVNEAALEFAKSLPGVKHIKTCYSKLYGGWYLFIYTEKEKGKKYSLYQYSWDRKAKEWLVIYHLKELPPERLEFHLKGEVDDEKCFVLK